MSFFFSSPSGFLSGKFKRDELPSPETRIGFTALEEQKRVLQSQPAWTILKEKDAAWELLDIMRDIATAHGKDKFFSIIILIC